MVRVLRLTSVDFNSKKDLLTNEVVVTDTLKFVEHKNRDLNQAIDIESTISGWQRSNPI